MLAEAPLVEVGAITVAARSHLDAAIREIADTSSSLFIAKTVGALATGVDVEVSRVVWVLDKTASSDEIRRAGVLMEAGSSAVIDTTEALEAMGFSGSIQETVVKGGIAAEVLSLLVEVLLSLPEEKVIEVLGSTGARSIVDELDADEMTAADLGSWAEPATFPTPLTGAQPASVSGVPRKAAVTSGPGKGYLTSVVSVVLQPLPRFATKISGRAEKGTTGAAPSEPATIVTGEQLW